MDALFVLLVAFNFLVVVPAQLYAFIRGINVQRYNLGIAKGRRYKHGFWWRQATALARSRQATGANFIITVVFSALALLSALFTNAWLSAAMCSYILVNALVATNFLALQLPVIDAEQAAATSTTTSPPAASN